MSISSRLVRDVRVANRRPEQLTHRVRAQDAPARAARVQQQVGDPAPLVGPEPLADWDAEAWSMRPEVLDRLAATLEVLARLGPRGLFVEALWVGETARETVSVTPRKLAEIAKSGKLGTHTRYAVVTDNAGLHAAAADERLG